MTDLFTFPGALPPSAPAPGPSAPGDGPGRAPSFGLASPDASDRMALTPAQIVAGSAVVLLVVGAALWFALTTRPATALRPDIFADSIVLSNESQLPTLVDLARLEPAVKLKLDTPLQIQDEQRAGIRFVRGGAGTWMFDEGSGATNLLGTDFFPANPRAPFVPALVDGRFLLVPSGDDAFLIGRPAGESVIFALTREAVETADGGEFAQRVTRLVHAPLVDADHPAVTMEGALYVLVAVDGRAELQRLDLSSDRTTVASTPISRFGPRSELMAVGGHVVVLDPASDRITVVDDAGTVRTVAVPGGTADDVVPVQADSRSGTVWFATIRAGRWTVHGWGRSDLAPVASHDLGLSGPAADAAPPVESGGVLFVVSRADASTRRFELATGAELAPAPYPRSRAGAAADLSAAQLAAVEVAVSPARVVVNVPASDMAGVFTTGPDTDPALHDISKRDAPEFDPTKTAVAGKANANSTTSTTAAPGQDPATTTTLKPKPVDLTCEEKGQTPSNPDRPQVDPSAEQATVTWDYRRRETTDCYPTDWTVEVENVAPNEDPPERGAIGVSAAITEERSGGRFAFPGLKPDRRWRVRVIAHMYGKSAESDWEEFETEPTDPDPPQGVRVTNDGRDGWRVELTGCSAAGACRQEPTGFEVAVDPAGCNGPEILAPGISKTLVVPGGRTARGMVVSLDELPDYVGVRGTVKVRSVGVDRRDGSALHSGFVDAEPACVEGWRQPPAAPDLLVDTAEAGDGTYTATITPRFDDGLRRKVYGTQSFLLDTTVRDRVVVPGPNGTFVVSGLAPKTTYDAVLTLSRDGATPVSRSKSFDTRALSWDGAVDVAPIELVRKSGDESSPDFDVAVGHLEAKLSTAPEAAFIGLAELGCGTAPIPVRFPAQATTAVVADFEVQLIGSDPRTCGPARITQLAEDVVGSAPKYDEGDVSRTVVNAGPVSTTIEVRPGRLDIGPVTARPKSDPDAFRYSPLGHQRRSRRSSVQTVALSGVPTTGTWKLELASVATEELAFDIDAPTLQTQLQQLSTIGPGGATVVQDGTSFVVTFGGDVLAQPVPDLVLTSSSLDVEVTITADNTDEGVVQFNCDVTIQDVTPRALGLAVFVGGAAVVAGSAIDCLAVPGNAPVELRGVYFGQYLVFATGSIDTTERDADLIPDGPAALDATPDPAAVMLALSPAAPAIRPRRRNVRPHHPEHR